MRATLTALAAALVLWAQPAAAQQSGSDSAADALAPYLGAWRGTGVIEGADAMFFANNARELDVRIWREEDGFAVEWITIIREGDPDNPEMRRRYALLTFLPAGPPGRYVATTSGDPTGGGQLRWAALSETGLRIYIMAINEDGSYEMSRYSRRITEAGMDLIYTRHSDGELLRTVTGALTRVE